MKIDLIQYAIPFFFLFIFMEIGISLWKKRQVYDLHDSLADLGCGITDQICNILFATLYLTVYTLVYESSRLLTLSSTSPLIWVLCFLGVDVLYYWFHRCSHRINFLWGGHVPHHQSEEYNLTVALRQGVFQSHMSFWFYLPLALLGFHPLMFLVCKQINTIYQFWIHTRLIDKMGPLEWLFNTPSHHRVHHGKNPVYIDKNHAGVLIVWDKLFGSFEPEHAEEPVVYGTVKPLNSWNPLWANLDHYIAVWKQAQRFPRWTDRIKVWLMPPGWTPAGEAEIPEVTPETAVKYRTALPLKANLYLFVQFVVMLVLAVIFLDLGPKQPLPIGLSALGFLLLSLFSISALSESRPWIFQLEATRLLLLALLAYFLLTSTLWMGIFIGFALVSLGVLLMLRRAFVTPPPRKATMPS